MGFDWISGSYSCKFRSTCEKFLDVSFLLVGQILVIIFVIEEILIFFIILLPKWCIVIFLAF